MLFKSANRNWKCFHTAAIMLKMMHLILSNCYIWLSLNDDWTTMTAVLVTRIVKYFCCVVYAMHAMNSVIESHLGTQNGLAPCEYLPSSPAEQIERASGWEWKNTKKGKTTCWEKLSGKSESFALWVVRCYKMKLHRRQRWAHPTANRKIRLLLCS